MDVRPCGSISECWIVLLCCVEMNKRGVAQYQQTAALTEHTGSVLCVRGIMVTKGEERVHIVVSVSSDLTAKVWQRAVNRPEDQWRYCILASRKRSVHSTSPQLYSDYPVQAQTGDGGGGFGDIAVH